MGKARGDRVRVGSEAQCGKREIESAHENDLPSAAMRAALAIAHKILVAAFHMLAKGVAYHELGEAHLDQIRQTAPSRQVNVIS